MSIKYKSLERGEPGVKGGGKKKFYAAPVLGSEVTLEAVTKKVEKTSTVSGADIRAVLYAMVDTIVDDLSDGNIVRLGELGSLRVSFSSDGVSSPNDVNTSIIKGAKIIFTPGSKIKDMLKAAKYEKAK